MIQNFKGEVRVLALNWNEITNIWDEFTERYNYETRLTFFG